MNEDQVPGEELLPSAGKGDADALAQLDSMGFLMKPRENAESYVGRIRAMHARFLEFLEKTSDGKSYEIYDGIVLSQKERIPDEIIEEAARTTEALYGFSVQWVPGYFVSRGLGWLWGGCALSDEEPDTVPVFIIRKRFETARKWFVYTRDELLSHELCHAARAPLHDRALEEHFAYAGSNSRLRRYMGNCFQTDRDAVFFLLPVLLLLLVQILIYVCLVPLPAWPFWILAFVWPGYLLFRNARQRRWYFTAERNVRACGFANPGAFLFRCTSPEIESIAKMEAGELARFIEETALREPRMQTMVKRFRKGVEEHADDQRSDRVS